MAVAVLGGRDHAEDVVQEAGVIALGKLDGFQVGTSFAAWMSQIVRFVALNHRRKLRRSRPAPIHTEDGVMPISAREEAGPAPISSTGRLVPDQSSFDDRVLRALSDLEEMARACLLLRVVAELAYRDISRCLGIPEGTAMSHVHRSRAALRAALSSREGEA